jgi:4-oxalocrotonate tautomerase
VKSGRSDRKCPTSSSSSGPGRSEQQKAQLSKEIVADVMAVLSSGDEWISVAIEEIEPEDWVEQV